MGRGKIRISESLYNSSLFDKKEIFRQIGFLEESMDFEEGVYIFTGQSIQFLDLEEEQELPTYLILGRKLSDGEIRYSVKSIL